MRRSAWPVVAVALLLSLLACCCVLASCALWFIPQSRTRFDTLSPTTAIAPTPGPTPTPDPVAVSEYTRRIARILEGLRGTFVVNLHTIDTNCESPIYHYDAFIAAYQELTPPPGAEVLHQALIEEALLHEENANLLEAYCQDPSAASRERLLENSRAMDAAIDKRFAELRKWRGNPIQPGERILPYTY